MKNLFSKFVVIGVSTVIVLNQQVAFCGGSSPQDTAELRKVEEMTEKEYYFQGNLSGEAIGAYIKMSHKERAMVMDIVNKSATEQGGPKISANEAVMMVIKGQSAPQ